MTRKHTAEKGVYCLTSPSGKRYVGIGMSRDGIMQRFGQYRRLDKCVHSQTALYNALCKHGPENFKYETILKTCDHEIAKRTEIQLIALWGTTLRSKGYNITHGGDGWSGHKHTDEYKERMRTLNTGRKHSDESKARMSASHRGRPSWNKGKPYPQARRKHNIEELIRAQKTRYGAVGYIVKFPDGSTHEVPLLSVFCAEKNLCRSHMQATMRGIRSHHKGYSILGKCSTMTPQE